MAAMSGSDPERQPLIAFLLVFFGIRATGALILWLLYGTRT